MNNYPCGVSDADISEAFGWHDFACKDCGCNVDEDTFDAEHQECCIECGEKRRALVHEDYAIAQLTIWLTIRKSWRTLQRPCSVSTMTERMYYAMKCGEATKTARRWLEEAKRLRGMQ